MIASVFRLAPIGGEIYIDDLDTSIVDLATLRSNISIIPQEPVLFSGTIRYNLDPFGTKNDETIWKALENVGTRGSFFKIYKYFLMISFH